MAFLAKPACLPLVSTFMLIMFTLKSHAFLPLRNLYRGANSLRTSTCHSGGRQVSGKSRLYAAQSDASPAADKSPFFITTPIYYVNGLPHLGHAYTSVASDVIARFHRCDGRPVYFLTGTDEHGQKVEQSATGAHKTPIAFADEVSAKFRNLVDVLGCSHDDFIRTTENRHKDAVSVLWKKLEENGQIYLGAYEGWYSIRDEAFYTETELVNGKAPTGADVEWVKEESYFFRLSEWTQKLLDFYEKNPDFIGPKGRRNEVISFVAQEGGLKDLSVSRTTFSWGIPVPGNPKHVVYVWLDALTNYMTAVGYPDSNADNFKKFWPASLHVVGKDILRFHAVFWPAFLMAAGIEPPKRVYAHGWWTKDGEKMSKSVGNVLDPYQLLDQYGMDYLRYFLVAEVPFGNDGDFTHEAFTNRINSDLANDLGNLAQRTLTMIQKNLDGKIPEPGEGGLTSDDEALLKAAEDALALARGSINQQNLKAYCETVIGIAKLGNKYIDVQAPWTLRKSDTARFQTVMYVLAEAIRRMGILLLPVVPNSCHKMLDQLGCPADLRTFDSISSRLAPGTPIGVPSPIFPKIDPTLNKELNPASSPSSPAAEKPKAADKPSKAAEIPETATLDDIAGMIVSRGNDIRELKARKAAKDELQPSIDALLALKERYKALNGGKAYDPPK